MAAAGGDGFPFAFGIAAALASALTSMSSAGCGAFAERTLVTHAEALAAKVNGLHLGELGGCDSGDPPTIEWDHASLNELVASAEAAGCHDAYLEDWEGEYSFMVCGDGPTPLLLSISPDLEDSGAAGDISFDR